MISHLHRFASAASLAIGAVAVSMSVAVSGAGTVPMPTVTGPIAAAAVGDASRDDPFFAVREITLRNLNAGYILKADADDTIAAAERSPIGRR